MLRTPAALGMSAAMGVVLLLTNTAAPATAEILHEEIETVAFIESLQQIEVPVEAVIAPVVRGEYTVEMHSVVQWPCASGSEVSKRFSSGHHGVDLLPGLGTPVEVITKGTVTQSGLNGSYGYSVTVEHIIDGQRVTSFYGHMQADLRVSVGQEIEMGTVVGLVGSSGASTGPHLHFGIAVNGVEVEPYSWITKTANDWLWV